MNIDIKDERFGLDSAEVIIPLSLYNELLSASVRQRILLTYLEEHNYIDAKDLYIILGRTYEGEGEENGKS